MVKVDTDMMEVQELLRRKSAVILKAECEHIEELTKTCISLEDRLKVIRECSERYRQYIQGIESELAEKNMEIEEKNKELSTIEKINGVLMQSNKQIETELDMLKADNSQELTGAINKLNNEINTLRKKNTDLRKKLAKSVNIIEELVK